MRLELESLQKCVTSLSQAVEKVSDSDFINTQDDIVKNILKAGIIQNFKITYEISHKMLKRQMEQDMPNPAAVDEMNFRDLLLEGCERGYIADVEKWLIYRKQRGTTSHTYDSAKADLKMLKRSAAN